ncbi:MAG: hypothetical protein WAL24_09135, partial [Nitrososphaeraceae archaeon]
LTLYTVSRKGRIITISFPLERTDLIYLEYISLRVGRSGYIIAKCDPNTDFINSSDTSAGFP